MAGLCIVDIKPNNTTASYFLGLTRNLSREGFSFESQNFNLTQGDILEFRLSLPEGKSSAAVIGKVLWQKETGYECLTGIRIHDPDDTSRRDIDKLLLSLQNPHPETLTGKDQGKASRADFIMSQSSPLNNVTARETAKRHDENKSWNRKFFFISIIFIVIVTAVFIFSAKPDHFNNMLRSDKAASVPLVPDTRNLDGKQDTRVLPGIADVRSDTPVEPVPAKPQSPGKIMTMNLQSANSGKQGDVSVAQSRPAPPGNKPLKNRVPASLVFKSAADHQTAPPSDSEKPENGPTSVPDNARAAPAPDTPPPRINDFNEAVLAPDVERTDLKTDKPGTLDREAVSDNGMAMPLQDFISYRETFDDNSHNWDIFDIGAASAGIGDGFYTIENKKREGTLVILHFHKFPHDRDFAVEARITALDNVENHYYGFVFGASNALNNFSFQIRADNHYIIRKYSNGATEDLATGEINNASMNRVGPNVLKIFHRDKGMRFYINNHYVAEINQPDFFGNRIGFILEGKSKIAVEETRSWLKNIHT